MLSVDIIIVNWNTGILLLNCLKSLDAISQVGFELNKTIVIDNGSQDESLNGIKDIRLPLTIVQNKINRGFAAACNQGAKHSKSDFLLFLNPDTLLEKDCLSISSKFLLNSIKSAVGIIGIQLLNEAGKVSQTCARFPTPGSFFVKMLALDRFFPKKFASHFMKEWDHEDSRYVDQVMGAFSLIRRSLFEELGGFDERFFVYFEEVDFAFRARKTGWSSYYLAEAQAYHKGGGTSEQVKAARLFYSLRSRILYCYKHFGWAPATGVLLGTLFIEPFTRMAYAAIRLSSGEMVETLKGYAMLWRDSPNWFRRAITRV
jgi:N-acetylglucosaminyl-diphospho-decaprenol L-rhamnosyltransferase